MPKVVKVKTFFDNIVKYYLINSKTPLQKGMLFVGTTKFGQDLMEIACPKCQTVSDQEWEEILKSYGTNDNKKNRFSFEPVLDHPAKDFEIKNYHLNQTYAQEYMKFFRQKIEEHDLEMKILSLYYPLSKERLVCIYTAEKRVDFREFVKDIGSIIKQRIEMFQMDIREAVSLSGICGCCGRMLCCSLGCAPFQNCPKKKEQLLKISGKSAKFLGLCGKTKCCMTYELETYEMEKELFPEIGVVVESSQQDYTVKETNFLRNSIILAYEDGTMECRLEDIKIVYQGGDIHYIYKPCFE